MDLDSREKQAEQLAGNILTLSRNSLIVNFRFLDRAVASIDFICDDNISFETDGAHLYYSPWFIISQYKAEQSSITRNLMHSLLHCIYRHSFVGADIKRPEWNLACDIAVESTINTIDGACIRSRREKKQLEVIRLMEAEVNCLNAEKIYAFLRHQNMSEEDLEKMRLDFLGDNHSLWYGESDENAKFDKNIQLKKIWEDVAKRMQTELETINRDKDSALIQNLRQLNRSKYSYTDFLRRFGVHGEVMQLSDEEFDNNYYTYGLSLYGNIPLIEPLEYKEEKRIRDFVIAIDTSGSVKGEVVQSFIQHTHDILMAQRSFFDKINLHIIQCDHLIREDALITSKEMFDEYIKSLTLKGFETTDFRPVFEYVDSLVESKEITNLQGLLYFTDGRGIFPEKAPVYDTAFIIKEDNFNLPDVPSWAQQITISEENILDKRFSN